MTQTSGGKPAVRRRLDTSTPKASSPRKMLPRPATRTRGPLAVAIGGLLRDRHDLFRGKIPEAAVSAMKVGARIIVYGHCDIDPILQVAVYRLHRGDPAGEKHVY